MRRFHSFNPILEYCTCVPTQVIEESTPVREAIPEDVVRPAPAVSASFAPLAMCEMQAILDCGNIEELHLAVSISNAALGLSNLSNSKRFEESLRS